MRYLILGLISAVGIAACGADYANNEESRIQRPSVDAVFPTQFVDRKKFEENDFTNIADAFEQNITFGFGGGSGGGQAGDGGASRQEQGAAQFIAYTYDIGLRFPQAGVEPAMQAHIAACEAAGPRLCVVTASTVNNQSDDNTSAHLDLRAVPDWIDTFQAGLDEEVAAAKGEIVSRGKESVDLTRQILDTDARLDAKITLKERLEDLLATREGDIGELLQVERELARVTGEIESMTSNLKALRLRVSMSEMGIAYTSKRSLVSGGRSNPLASAFGDFFYNMSAALASVITAFAVGLPWLIIITIFLFIWLRGIWPWVRRKRTKIDNKA